MIFKEFIQFRKRRPEERLEQAVGEQQSLVETVLDRMTEVVFSIKCENTSVIEC